MDGGVQDASGKSKAPLKEMFCTSADAGSVAGTTCLGETGCHRRERQCLGYFLTAPYFHANLSFWISDKLVVEEVKKIVVENNKYKKLRGKTSVADIEKRREHEEVYLRTTFKVLLKDVKHLIKKCPERSSPRKEADIVLVDNFQMNPPVRQIVLLHEHLFKEAVTQRVERRQQQQQEAEHQQRGEAGGGRGESREVLTCKFYNLGSYIFQSISLLGMSSPSFSNHLKIKDNPHGMLCCSFCGKTGEVLACSCGQVCYCGPVCQKSGWPLHRLACPLVVCRSVEGRGLALLATRRIRPGRRLVLEEPLLTFAGKDMNLLLETFAKLASEKKLVPVSV